MEDSNILYNCSVRLAWLQMERISPGISIEVVEDSSTYIKVAAVFIIAVQIKINCCQFGWQTEPAEQLGY